MSRTDFHLDFKNKLPHDMNADDLEVEADRRLRALADGHTDMIGGAVALEELSQEATPHAYQARVMAYVRPQNVVAVEKGDSPDLALDGALKAIERQVRAHRDKLRSFWKQPHEAIRMDNLYDLTPAEIYASYFGEVDPRELLEYERDTLATQLMTKSHLDQEAAYYAADQILVFAQETAEANP